MKLISMIDFVLEQGTEINTGEMFYRKTYSYAIFLKQPLELGMFIPCDENGNVLEEPKLFKDYSKTITKTTSLKGSDIIDCEEYQQAKERCLFDNFKFIDAINYHILKERTVEYLADFGTINLTPTAIKQLGL